jgi:hypothetical protein
VYVKERFDAPDEVYVLQLLLASLSTCKHIPSSTLTMTNGRATAAPTATGATSKLAC